MRVAFLSEPRPPAALTPEQSRAFALVAAAPDTYRVPPGPDAAALGTALRACEAAGLVMPAGRGWRLTPNGLLRWMDIQARAGRPR